MRSATIIISLLVLGAAMMAHAAVNDMPGWSAPPAMALKRVSDVPVGRHSPVLFGNLDCTPLTYRLVGHSDMRSGCFTPTSFGMLDSDSETVIFNGTDEGLPLKPYVNRQVLAPWPKALNLLAFSGNATGGSYVSMYDDPLTVIRDQRDLVGRLTAKQLTAPPEHKLHDAEGRPLLVHPQATAFSSNDSWLAVETVYGYFARVNLASLDVKPFAPAFNSWGGSEPQDAQVAVSDDGRFVAVENGRESSFKVYDLSDCAGKTCHSYDYWPFISGRIAGLRTITHIRFLNGGLLSFEVPSGGIYELAPRAHIDHLTDYIGLGDSYTSGEGAFDYLPGTDTADDTCHLSANSYPLLLTRDLFGPAGGHSVACSGAVINDVTGTDGDYNGQVKQGASLDEILSGYLVGYVPQELFVRQYQPGAATVSIGGNDIGFGDILQKCVMPGNCYDSYESREEEVDLVDRTVPRWTALFRQLKAASPGSAVYAIGYPSVAADTGRCGLNVRLSKSELEFAAELIHYLDRSIRKAAVAADVPYVDISRALAGHRLCEASSGGVAVNGLTAGNDFGVFGIGLLGRESYHPNALGHQLIEQAILRQTDNLAGSSDGPSESEPASGNLLGAPRTGRALNTLVPDSTVADKIARAGDDLPVRINGAHDGLRPASRYTVHLDGPEGPSLGYLDSDQDGDISGSVPLPEDTPPDVHTIDVIGPGQSDRPVDVTQPIYVPGYVPGYGEAATGNQDTPLSFIRNGPGKARTKHIDEINQTASAGPRRAALLADDAFMTLRRAAGRHRRGLRSSVAALVAGASVMAWTMLVYYRRRIIESSWYYLRRCFTIVIMRKFGVAVFSVVLFASLLVLAFSASSNLALTDQQKVEKWLSDSNVYGAFVESAIAQADQTAGTDQSGGVSLSDTAVKQAAESSFSSDALKQDVHVFLNSNYAWLNGKADKPSFRVDLSDAKQNFAERVGKYVATYLKGLSPCSPAQTAKINPQTADPLTLDCRPPNIKPAKIGAEVSEQLADSTQFLNDPVLTADNFNPGNSADSADQPYYQRLSGLPGVYQIATKIPLVAGILVLLSLAAVIIIAARKRKAFKVLAVVFGLAGLVMVATKFVSDQAFHTLENHVFNASTVGQLQKAMTVFFHHVENQLVKVDLLFGVGYLVVALALVSALIMSRPKGLRMPKRLQSMMPSGTHEPEAPRSAQPTPPMPPAPQPSAPQTPARPPKPPRRKPPRLIQ